MWFSNKNGNNVLFWSKKIFIQKKNMRFFFPKLYKTLNAHTKGKEKKMYDASLLKRSRPCKGVFLTEERKKKKREKRGCCVFTRERERECFEEERSRLFVQRRRSHYHDRQLPQHVRRVRVRVPVPAVFMFQGSSSMRALLSCVCVVS